MPSSPFSYTRYELEGRHLYHISPELQRQLEKSVPLYVVGSRGTGKTTLLRYLNWKERLTNVDLIDQLDDAPFASGIVGVYLRLPNVQLALLDRWLGSLEEPESGAYFSTYLELNCLELMIEAVLGISDAGVIAPDLDAESAASARLNDLFALSRPPASLTQCLKQVRRIRRALDTGARDRLDPRSVFDAHIVVQSIGSIVRLTAPILIRLCDEYARAEVTDGWTFRLCLDEAEALNPTQQLTLNTIVRLAEWPAFPIAAYVARPTEDRKTLVPNLTLQRADLDYVVRDEVSNNEFDRMADGIARLRLKRALMERGSPTEGLPEYSVRRQLGPLRVNGLLERILRRSESPLAIDLLTKAESFHSSGDVIGDDLPIYQTYLLEKLDLSVPDSRPLKRRFASEEFRKKMVAAYLSICNDIGARPEYASSDMLFRTCDKCIRDFLWQMDAVFERSGQSLEDFASGRSVAVEGQVGAMRYASERKLARLPRLIETAPSLAQSLVEGLGELTASIQRADPQGRHLASTERGNFGVDLDNDNVGRALADVIEDAAEWGFLRLLNSAPPRWEFRVHTSLAPLYGFSYRGSYYPYLLLQHELEGLARATDSRARREEIGKILVRSAANNAPDDIGRSQGAFEFDE